MAADGRGRMRLTDGYTANYAPTFDDQRRIFFTSNRGGHENVWSLVPDGVIPELPSGGQITGLPDRQKMSSTVVAGMTNIATYSEMVTT